VNWIRKAADQADASAQVADGFAGAGGDGAVVELEKANLAPHQKAQARRQHRQLGLLFFGPA